MFSYHLFTKCNTICSTCNPSEMGPTLEEKTYFCSGPSFSFFEILAIMKEGWQSMIFTLSHGLKKNLTIKLYVSPLQFCTVIPKKCKTGSFEDENNYWLDQLFSSSHDEIKVFNNRPLNHYDWKLLHQRLSKKSNS